MKSDNRMTNRCRLSVGCSCVLTKNVKVASQFSVILMFSNNTSVVHARLFL